jgi:isopenicillin N synthase-like dioxygenase
MSIVSKGRYVGFSADPNREYLQMRRPLAQSGTVWPRPYFVERGEEAFADEMLTVFNVLDQLARACMEAVCEVLDIDRKWMFTELLDDTTPPPAPPSSSSCHLDKKCDSMNTRENDRHQTNRYGASVLRVYNYRNKKEKPLRLDINMSCGSHADLGLVTVSPCATVPGLQMWNLDRMLWADVESDASTLHFSVFAGETLGYITNGLITAPLHRVPATVVPDEASRRMSMPYFLRARPQACLNPKRQSGTPPLFCRDFMEDMVFKTRPWRRETCATPDY